MPNMMQSSAAWLGEKLQTSAGRSVTLHQGGVTLTGITAVAYQHEHEVVDDSGFLIRVMSYDWTFVEGDLGTMNLKQGALIVETLNDVQQRYEVVPIGKRPAVERLDSSGILLTVHSKRVGSG